MKWKSKLFKDVNHILMYEKNIKSLHKKKPPRIHLAIFSKPFLKLIENNNKIIESRFSIKRISPFEKVFEGDIILLKESCGPIKGYFRAGNVIYIENITKRKLNEIKKKHADDIGSIIDPNFWKQRQYSKYATLIQIKDYKKIEPINVRKTDRRSWIVLSD